MFIHLLFGGWRNSACVCTHVQMWRPEFDTGYLPQSLSTLFEIRSLTEYGALSQLVWLVKALGSTSLCHSHHHPSNGATDVTSGFYVDCGIQTWSKTLPTEISVQLLYLRRGEWRDRVSHWIRLDWLALWLQMCTHAPDVYMRAELRSSCWHCILPTEKSP